MSGNLDGGGNSFADEARIGLPSPQADGGDLGSGVEFEESDFVRHFFFSRNPNRWLNPSSEKMMLRGLKLLLKRSVVFLGGSFRKFSATYFFIIFGKKSYVLYFFF